MDKKNKKTNLYEGMFILSTMLSEGARKKSFEKITGGIEKFGGTIKKVIDMGRRRLAYEINGRREGYYYLLYFDVCPSAIKELWGEYHLNEDLMRFMTLRTNNVRDNLEFKSIVQQ